MKKRITFILTLILFINIIISCNRGNNNQTKSKNIDSLKIENTINSDSNRIDTIKAGKDDEKIYKLIFAIPEVKEESKFIEKESKGIGHLEVMIYQTPEETDEKCYHVKAGVDDGTRFITHFNFFVNPISFKIKYLDTVDDTLISLEAWRKKLKKEKHHH